MENKPKNREWVKTVAIVFLSVLLVLTFFSSSIRNRSLTEVSTEYVGSGTITAKVRGSGIVEANGTYDVKAEQTHKILAVTVKEGQNVEEGDVLFVLGEGDSDELAAATQELESLQQSYQQTRLSMPNHEDEYVLTERKIEKAKSDAEKAKEAMNLAEAQMAVNAGSEDEESGIPAARALSEASAQAYREAFTSVRDEIKPFFYWTHSFISAEGEDSENHVGSMGIKTSRLEKIFDGADYFTYEEMSKAVKLCNADISGFKDNIYSLEKKINSLSPPPVEEPAPEEGGEGEDGENTPEPAPAPAPAEDHSAEIAVLTAKLEKVKENLAAAQNYQQILKMLEEKAGAADVYKDSYEQLIGSEAFFAAKNAYQDALDYVQELERNYSATKKANNKAAASTSLELRAVSEKIEAAKKKVEELSGGSENRITSPVAGTVSTIIYTAGNYAPAGETVCTLAVDNAGYSLSFPVTTDQVKRLRIGETATVSNFYWGSMIEATLTSIKNDPKNPQGSRILTFDLEGDVNPGSELTISVGSKSATYDYVVPNSAIRTDSNGTFVLTVESKNSPLGNRYFAKRVEVTVLATDDNNSAVNGEFDWSSYVITISSDGSLIKDGDQVRLAD